VAIALAQRRLPPELAARFMEQVGAGLIAEIQQVEKLAWLPGTIHVRIADTLLCLVGAATARMFWRDLALAGYKRGFLYPVIEGSLRVFGRTPHSVFRVAPQAHALLSRNSGILTVPRVDDPNSASLHYDQMPEELLRSEGHLEALHANCEAAVQYLDVESQVTRHLEDGPRPRLCYVARWR
jgi:hypothetical protein